LAATATAAAPVIAHPVVPAGAPTKSVLRFRGRSFLALVLAPQAPLEAWLADLAAWTTRSPGFFAGRAVILDLSGLKLSKSELTRFIADLDGRGVRVMAVEGADPDALGLGLPPAVSGGRETGIVEGLGGAARTRPALAQEPTCLMLDEPVRSGQRVFFPKGDVVVAGSVASGAEVVAGGSIHIYGALRGRAIAGVSAGASARIYCRKFDPELLAIDGLYKSAEDVDQTLRGRAVQVRLDSDTLHFAPLD
jgi:septum site-determining protein MinC